MSSLLRSSALLVVLLAAAGCSKTVTGAIPGGGGGGASLPVSGTGKMLAVRLPGTASTSENSLTKTPQLQTNPTGAVAVDRTAAAGVGFTASVDADPNPNPNQGSALMPAVLVTGTADAPMQGGATLIGLDKAKGNVYFENGNFGDPQVESASAAVSTVGVYNPMTGSQISLKDATTVRYRDGVAADGEVNYGVGYIGNPTAAMPSTGQATYRGFWEGGIGAYDNGAGGTQQLYLRGDAELAADFGAGKVTGGVTNAELGTSDPLGTNPRNPNAAVTGLTVDATVTGTEYAGTAALVDAGGNPVGTLSNAPVIGGFFGANAAETAAAVSLEGNMELDGASRDYVLQGVIGGVKN